MVTKAIRVKGLGKEYQIGEREAGYTTFRDAIVNTFAAPFRRLRRLSGGSVPAEKFWALKDVSFDVEPGEVVGIIGRNGAGKSTLLKVLSQITEPTTGEVELNGRVASLLEVGTGFHPELTGRENIYLNGSILGMSRAEIKRKFDEIVAFAEVEKFLDTPVKRYSSGMYVRLAFAVAAHLDPEILIVDEVLAVGDAEFQKKCLGKMGEVAKGGRTVLFVSHNMAALTNLCGKVVMLRSGHVVDIGPSTAIVEKYLIDSTKTAKSQTINRPHWAEPLIQSMRTFGHDTQDQAVFPLGSAIGIEMTIQVPSGQRIKEPGMGVVLSHSLLGIVGAVNTRMTEYYPPAATEGTVIYRCQLLDLPLLQGTYTADIWLSDGSKDLDVATAGVEFQVQGTDVYGTGRLPHHGLGLIYLKPTWDCIRAEQSADSARQAGLRQPRAVRSVRH